MNSTKPTTARAVIIKNNKLLVMWRRKNGEDYFTLPGGHIAVGESPEQTAARETLEETSLTVKARQLLYRVTDLRDDTTYFYMCDYVSGEPKLPETSEESERSSQNNTYKPAWVNYSEVRGHVCHPKSGIKQTLADWQSGIWPTDALTLTDKRDKTFG